VDANVLGKFFMMKLYRCVKRYFLEVLD